MFTPIHQLSQFSANEAERLQERWDTREGRMLADDLRQRIRDGAGEDFLQFDFQQHRLGFLESEYDLRGLHLVKENFKFPPGDHFEHTDFSYASWYHCTFSGACFVAQFNFVRLFSCEFRDCTFSFNSFYGARLENVRFIHCQFIENNSFTNCECTGLQVRDSFFPENLFSDCRFDAATVVEDPTERPFDFGDLKLNHVALSAIFRGLKEAYGTGGIANLARTYFFRQMQAARRFNTPSRPQQLASLFVEHVAGYGVRPLRVLRTMAIVLLASCLVFAIHVGLKNALILGAGAFFTFGAGSDLLREASAGWWLWYILTAFSGVSLTALFVTVLANVWLRER